MTAINKCDFIFWFWLKMLFTCVRRRNKKLLVLSSIVFMLMVVRHALHNIHFQRLVYVNIIEIESQQPRGLERSAPAWPSHELDPQKSFVSLANRQLAPLPTPPSSGRKNTTLPPYPFKVVEPGTNVKVPEWEVYVLSAFVEIRSESQKNTVPTALTSNHTTIRENTTNKGHAESERTYNQTERNNERQPKTLRRKTEDSLPDTNFHEKVDHRNKDTRVGPNVIKTEKHTPEMTSNEKDVIVDVYLTTWTDVLNAQINTSFVCCFTLGPHPHQLLTVEANRTDFHARRVNMTYAEYHCPVKSDQPLSHVAFANHSCSGQLSPFMVVEKAEDPREIPVTASGSNKKHLPSVAVCLPAAYGNLTVQPLVEWLELQRMLGVSRVHVHYTELSNQTLSVFRVYQQQGFVTLRPFLPAIRTGDPPRGLQRTPSRWKYQAYADAWVNLNDCRHRLAEFTVVMVIDLDEILIPKAPLWSLPRVFQKALVQHPDAASFSSDSYIHLTDSSWGVTHANTSISFLRFLNRTVSSRLDSRGKGKSSPKTFFLPPRTNRSIRLRQWPRPGFQQYELPKSLATLHHFRSCKEDRWGHKCLKWKQVRDSRLLRFQSRWESAVSRAITLFKTMTSNTAP